MDKPFSQAAQNNQQAILAVLQRYVTDGMSVLEIGSGTGQHALYFANALPTVSWQTSDLPEHHAGINAWIAAAEHDNVLPPLVLDVNHNEYWADERYDIIYTANTAHIMAWPEVELMVAGIVRHLNVSGFFVIYGPFNRDGQYTSPSNQAFDAHLKQQYAHMGLRDIVDMQRLAKQHGLALLAQHEMPANNMVLVFRKLSA